jgi:hypothetical protein
LSPDSREEPTNDSKFQNPQGVPSKRA